MPITPERQHLYPPKKVWAAIRGAVLARAGNSCEICGLDNGSLGFRGHRGDWRDCSGCCDEADNGEHAVRIVLTIHHRDGNPTNNDGWETAGKVLSLDESNLTALCQQCHNRADGPMRAQHAAETRAKKAMRGYGEGLFDGRQASGDVLRRGNA